jgi:hypothetical protein
MPSPTCIADVHEFSASKKFRPVRRIGERGNIRRRPPRDGITRYLHTTSNDS